MKENHIVSSSLIAGTLFLLPIIFIPGGIFFLSVLKTSLLVVLAVLALMAFVWESARKSRINLPWHYILGVSLLIPIAYFLSALMSSVSNFALFGYEFEIGTFAYMAIACGLLLLSSFVFTEKAAVVRAVAGFLLGLSLVLVFSALRIIFGEDFLSLGVFVGRTDNPIGSWADLAIASSLVAVIVSLIMPMLSVKKNIKIALYVLFGLCVFLLAVINFSIAFGITLLGAVISFVYLGTIERRFLVPGKKENNHSLVMPGILIGLSLIFLINPVVSSSGMTLGELTSSTFEVQNVDVRPSFSSTLGISASALKENPIFGSGPNTFGQDWFVYKSNDINSTPFWNTSFPFGVGFLPTQIAVTGIVGTILWVLFLVFLLGLGKRALLKMPESRSDRLLIVVTFMPALLVWASTIFYVPSMTVLTSAFIFTGILVAVSAITGTIPSYKLDFKTSASASFVSTLVAVGITAGAVVLLFIGFQKTASAFYYARAIKLSGVDNTSIEEVRDNLVKAIRFAPVDLHFVELSRLEFSKAQALANSSDGNPEEIAVQFQEAISQAISTAQSAVSLNSKNYRNWINLGSIYSALVPAPLSVEGAYESALQSYYEARNLNPQSPEPALLIARLEIARGKNDIAKDRLKESLSLKPDYASAYFTSAQIAIAENNIQEAIRSAETGAVLSPENPGVYFEIGLLKYSIEDYQGATNSLRKALDIVPNYANAKYYLGLSLARMGDIEGAQIEFEELYENNPESEEVRTILTNLREGNDPLLGVDPESSSIEDRDSLPVSSQTQ